MIALILRRLLVLPLVLAGVAVTTFLIAAVSPFDPIAAYVGNETPISRQTREEIARAWGLDKPLAAQMLGWLGRVVQGDLGYSRLQGGKPVAQIIRERIGPSALLVGSALGLVLVGGLVVGTLAAAYRDSWFDWLVRAVCHFSIASPSFWIALLFLLVFSVQLGWLPGAGIADPRAAEGGRIDLRRLVLPMLSLAFTQQAWFTMFVRNTVLDLLREDYIRFAQAHGKSWLAIVFRHALPNALIPFVTLIGVHLSEILGGTVLVESIFAWPGLGTLTRDAALGVDIPLLMAITLGASFLVVMGNLLADVAYRVLDPRVREGRL
ncbi:MAG: ABC transporter permease [Dehalococcoidia bacterium]|nr:ABC transporter permease [Dehalococcoidia bacterium]MDW8119710.1 ABC transporter permease [Chloroflexota bacterium]